MSLPAKKYKKLSFVTVLWQCWRWDGLHGSGWKTVSSSSLPRQCLYTHPTLYVYLYITYGFLLWNLATLWKLLVTAVKKSTAIQNSTMFQINFYAAFKHLFCVIALQVFQGFFCFVLFRKSLKNVLHMFVFSIAGRQPGITEAYNRYEAQ